MYGAYANLNDLIDFSEGVGEELFNRMDAIFELVKNPEADQFLALHFAYAKALDDRGQHEKALDHYIIGGRMKRAQLEYKELETHGFFDWIPAAFPKEVFENRKFPGLDDDRPVFIVGMPRSGSTLVEQILSSHPDVYGAGEVKYLAARSASCAIAFPSLPKYPEMAAKITPAQLDIVAEELSAALAQGAGNAKRITDKLLTNYFFLGLINLLFPKAKVIHTQRDPVDTCLSGFTKLFKDDMPHSYDLGELGRYYGKYRELMEHWEKVLPEGFMTTVVYEDVVADTEKEAKRLIEFLGLPWDDKCVDFHKSDRPVKTASVAQVRKPIYKTSVERWKKYGDGPSAAGRRRCAASPRRRLRRPRAKARSKRTPDHPIGARGACPARAVILKRGIVQACGHSRISIGSRPKASTSFARRSRRPTKPVMLYSIGKDSAVMLHLAQKAFFPSPLPFPLMHVDTTWKFRDMYALRDKVGADPDIDLIVYKNPEAERQGINPFDHGPLHTDMWKTEGLKQALDKYGFDAAFGGARRDEEKSRAKERVFSFRDRNHRWDPKRQRPELWSLYNVRKNKGESMRVFPLSNWTELDVWQYIMREKIEIVPLYFAAERPTVERDGLLLMVDDERIPLNGETADHAQGPVPHARLLSAVRRGRERRGYRRGDRRRDAAYQDQRAPGPGDRPRCAAARRWRRRSRRDISDVPPARIRRRPDPPRRHGVACAAGAEGASALHHLRQRG